MEQSYPEPTVGGLVIAPDGKMLLVRSHKWRGQYVIPGGHIELGESIEQALKRELREETGLDVHDPVLIGYQEFIYDPTFWKPRHYIFFDFACRSDSTEVTLNDEAESYIWVTLDEALALDLEPYTRRALERYREQQRGG